MNTTQLFLKHLISALEAIRYELEEDEARQTAGRCPQPTPELETIKAPRMHGRNSTAKRVFNLVEASTMLSMSKAYLYKLTSLRGIPYYKLGNRLLFDEQKLLAWMETHAVEPLHGECTSRREKPRGVASTPSTSKR